MELMKSLKTNLMFMMLALASTTLLGCSAAKTAMTKQELTVESHVSHSVVLEPLAPEERVIYVRVKDLSGNDMRRPMTAKIKQSLRDEGLQVTTNPKEANLMLTAFVISAKKTNKDELNAFLSSGYQGGAEGLITAGALASVTGASGRDLGAVALGGAAIGFLADTLISDDYYTFVMDVELRERPLEGDSIHNSRSTTLNKGFNTKNATNQSRTNSDVTRGSNYNWITYETRIISTANQMNLNIEDAKPLVINKASSTLVEFLL